MKHYLKFALSGLGVLLVAGLLYSQVGSSSADNDPPPSADPETEKMTELVRALYRQLGNPDEDLTCRLDYTIESVIRSFEDSLMTGVNKVSYVGNRTCLVVNSAEMSLYQDTGVGVTIVPSVKEIQIFASTPDELKDSRMEAMQAFQRELFNKSIVRECAELSESGNWRLVLEPDREFLEWYHVRRVEITFNPKERRIFSIYSEFDDKVPYVSLNLIYNRLECSKDSGRSNDLTSFSAIDKIFTPAGVLRSEYRDYEVIDHR